MQVARLSLKSHRRGGAQGRGREGSWAPGSVGSAEGIKPRRDVEVGWKRVKENCNIKTTFKEKLLLQDMKVTLTFLPLKGVPKPHGQAWGASKSQLQAYMNCVHFNTTHAGQKQSGPEHLGATLSLQTDPQPSVRALHRSCLINC